MHTPNFDLPSFFYISFKATILIDACIYFSWRERSGVSFSGTSDILHRFCHTQHVHKILWSFLQSTISQGVRCFWYLASSRASIKIRQILLTWQDTSLLVPGLHGIKGIHLGDTFSQPFICLRFPHQQKISRFAQLQARYSHNFYQDLWPFGSGMWSSHKSGPDIPTLLTQLSLSEEHYRNGYS